MVFCTKQQGVYKKSLWSFWNLTWVKCLNWKLFHHFINFNDDDCLVKWTWFDYFLIVEKCRTLHEQHHEGSPWLRGHRHLTENLDLRLWVQNPAAKANISSTPDWKKINKGPSVRVIVVCSDHRLLWWDSYNDVDCAVTSDESQLLKIIIKLILHTDSSYWCQKSYCGYFLKFCLESEILVFSGPRHARQANDLNDI